MGPRGHFRWLPKFALSLLSPFSPIWKGVFCFSALYTHTLFNVNPFRWYQPSHCYARYALYLNQIEKKLYRVVICLFVVCFRATAFTGWPKRRKTRDRTEKWEFSRLKRKSFFWPSNAATSPALEGKKKNKMTLKFAYTNKPCCTVRRTYNKGNRKTFRVSWAIPWQFQCDIDKWQTPELI